MTRCKFPVAHEVGAERTGGRARSGVLVEFPRQHAAGEGFAVAAQGEAVGHGGVRTLEFSQLAHVHRDFAQSGAIAQRHHESENAGGNEFGIELRVEILGRKSQSCSEFFLIDLRTSENRFFLGHGDALWAAVLEANLDRQNAGSRLLQDVNAAFLRRNNAQLREEKPRADDRVARELEFFFRGEDAQARERFLFGWLLDEDRLREIHFARDGEHFIVGEAVAVGDHRERISFEARVRENIKRVKAVFHGWWQAAARAGKRFQMRSSWATVLSLVMFPVFKVDFGSMSTM